MTYGFLPSQFVLPAAHHNSLTGRSKVLTAFRYSLPKVPCRVSRRYEIEARLAVDRLAGAVHIGSLRPSLWRERSRFGRPRYFHLTTATLSRVSGNPGALLNLARGLYRQNRPHVADRFRHVDSGGECRCCDRFVCLRDFCDGVGSSRYWHKLPRRKSHFQNDRIGVERQCQ
jgi:hypothetical protein